MVENRSMPGSLQLLRFYADAEPDSRGRLLSDIQKWSDDQLERTHDYIQWLFPLDEPSGFNIGAPILDTYSVSEFRSRIDLRQNFRVSWIRMLAFYGLQLSTSNSLMIVRSAFFAERSRNWITLSNHNHLRITRILKSLRLLGLEEEAISLFECLAEIFREESLKEEPGISVKTFEYWRGAVTGSWEHLSDA